MIGVTIGGYEITETLAEGGMGAVFLARHAVMTRDAVVKLLKPELSHDEAMTRRFLNEARAAAAINDPGIVQIFDVGFLPDGRAFIVMERLRGETLGQRLRTAGVSLDHAVHILRLLARTLDAAHAHGIVHRDLKPDNIFLVPDRDVTGGERTKILDFGIAKLAGPEHGQTSTRAGSIFGTPAYMAPEQCTDSATVDARADLYALGCIGYEMLTGKPPFGFGGLELIGAHLRDEPPPLRGANPATPDWLAVVIHRLLRKSPSERFASSAELLHALDSVNPRRSPPRIEVAPTLAADAPSAPAATLPSPSASPAPSPMATTHSQSAGMVTPPSPESRSRIPLLVGVLAVAVIGGVAVTWLASREGESEPIRPPIVAEPSRNSLADALDAAAREQWSAAIAAASQVPVASPDHVRAREVSERAQRELANHARYEEVVAELAGDDLDAARRIVTRIDATSIYRERALRQVADAELRLAAVKETTTATSSPTTKPATPKPPATTKGPSPTPTVTKPTYGEAIAKARAELAAGRYASVLEHARAALTVRPQDGEARMHATVAACALRDERTAHAMLPAAGTWREVTVGKCALHGITLE